MGEPKPARTKFNSKTTPKTESFAEWAVRYIAERGIDIDFAEQNGVEPVEDDEARREGYPARGGIKFNNYDPITKLLTNSGQLRHWKPPIYDGKPRKFSVKKGATPRPFFARCLDWKSAFKNTKIHFVISEGPTRALAGAQRGLYVIALLGVTCQGTGDSLDPTLSKVNWKGRRVYIAFDADARNNSQVRAQEVKLARKLAALGALVFIVRIPDITAGGHAGLDDLLALPGGLETFKALCNAAPQWGETPATDRKPQLQCLNDVQAACVPWAWKFWLAFGMLSMLSGDPDAGKTFIALAIAASLSNGWVPYTGEKCAAMDTIYMSVENSASFVIRPRFDALGGNPKRLHLLTGSILGDDKGSHVAITLQDVDVIEQAIKQTGAKLVIIDPLQSWLGAEVDSHRSNETRPVMDGLIQLAERHGVCILIVRHLAKSSGGRAIHHGLGSIDLTGAVRTEMLAGSAPDDPSARALVQIKNNLGPRAQSLRYEIVGKDMAAKLVWRGQSDLTSADLLAPDTGKKGQTEIAKAAEFLRGQLKAGPKLQKELVTDDFSVKTLQRAADRIGISKTRKEESGKGVVGPWEWALPKFSGQGGGESA